MRTLVSDLSVCLREWGNPPPEALLMTSRVLEIVAIAGVKNGAPVEHGRRAVDVILEVSQHSMSVEDGLAALDYLVS